MSIQFDTSAVNTFYNVADVRAIDRCAIHEAGIDGYALMTRAAEAALAVARDRYPSASRWQILCGAGNNGGDGYVLGMLAASCGLNVTLLALADPASLSGDALTASTNYLSAGGRVLPWSGALDDSADLLVDALLGSGLERDVGGAYADAVHSMNAHHAPVLALDIPTGLHGDSGAVMGVAVQADATVTFVGRKAGLQLGSGPDCTGIVFFSDLAIPVDCRSGRTGVMRSLTDRAVAGALKPRPRSAHKNSMGHVLVIGGGPGMPGAVRLAGEAALRSGAGLVSIATHPAHTAAIVGSRPELMVHGVSQASDLEPMLASANVIAIGPGLGQSDWAKALFSKALELDLPMVVDADALNLLASRDEARLNWVLTPHPGEAGRLLDDSAGNVQSDRLAALAALHRRYGGTVVLKGAGSLVSSLAGLPWVCTAGNPGMAAPGMGDVLTGVVAALYAQYRDAEAAAVLGVAVHARAGDRAARDGERGLLASDLMPGIRHWLNGR